VKESKIGERAAKFDIVLDFTPEKGSSVLRCESWGFRDFSPARLDYSFW
jgi:hypothetical protein